MAAVVPPLVASLPARAPLVPAAELLARVRASALHPYQGYAETRAGLGLPDLQGAGDLPSLLSTTTRMRTWHHALGRWRTDVLTAVGERDQYVDADGTVSWDAGRHRVTDVDGAQPVRLARPQDLLPPELGRRLAAEASPDEVSSLPARRVAGRDVPGLRVNPKAPDTTVGRVDLWADAGSGVPLEVVVTARGQASPAIVSRFLDVSLSDPSPSVVAFRPGPGARLARDRFADVAAAVDGFSPLVLPDHADGLARRGAHVGPALTYGRGFAVVAVLALPGRFFSSGPLFLPSASTVTGGWGQAKLVETPLLNGMVFTAGGVGYVLAGTVTTSRLEEVAASVAAEGVALR
jgi:hypothetical protein